MKILIFIHLRVTFSLSHVDGKTPNFQQYQKFSSLNNDYINFTRWSTQNPKKNPHREPPMAICTRSTSNSFGARYTCKPTSCGSLSLSSGARVHNPARCMTLFHTLFRESFIHSPNPALDAEIRERDRVPWENVSRWFSTWKVRSARKNDNSTSANSSGMIFLWYSIWMMNLSDGEECVWIKFSIVYNI